jgi:hypothetical protein
MVEPLKWYGHNADNPPWIRALAEGRSLAAGKHLVLSHPQITLPQTTQGTTRP